MVQLTAVPITIFGAAFFSPMLLIVGVRWGGENTLPAVLVFLGGVAIVGAFLWVARWHTKKHSKFCGYGFATWLIGVVIAAAIGVVSGLLIDVEPVDSVSRDPQRAPIAHRPGPRP